MPYRPGRTPPPDIEPPERHGFGQVDPARVAVLIAVCLPLLVAVALAYARCRG
jgi:hypothetical protein